MRRKTLQNAISAKFSKYSKGQIVDAIVAIGHDEKVRGERLSTADVVALSNELSKI